MLDRVDLSLSLLWCCDPLDFLWRGQKATLAQISFVIKKYFDDENVVRRCDFNHTLHEQRYDHYQGFQHTPGLLGLKSTPKLDFLFWGLFLLSDPPCFGGIKSGGSSASRLRLGTGSLRAAHP